jgi:hypothetical protein
MQGKCKIVLVEDGARAGRPRDSRQDAGATPIDELRTTRQPRAAVIYVARCYTSFFVTAA